MLCYTENPLVKFQATLLNGRVGTSRLASNVLQPTLNVKTE